MVSLALSGFAGALKAVGEDVQKQREEKLKQLELDRTERIANRQMDFNREISTNQIASQEKMTKAQQETSLKLGELSSRTSKDVATIGTTSSEKIAGAQIELGKDQLAARRQEVADQIASGEKIAGMQIGAQKDLQNMQAEAAQQLGIKPLQKADGTQVWTRPDGTRVEGPKDENGKEISLAITDTDTDEMKNVKYMMSLGVPQAEAIKLFNSKNDNRNLIEAGVFKSIIDGMSTMKNLGEADIDFARGKAKVITDGIVANTGTATSAAAPAAAGDTAAPAAAAPASATEPGTGAGTAPASGPVRPMPADKKDLSIGAIYPLNNGEYGKWNGSRFITVPPPNAPATGAAPRG